MIKIIAIVIILIIIIIILSQTHRRNENNSTKEVKSVTDYALHWKLSVPGSSRDEFVTIEDIRQTTTISGTLDVLTYIQPTNDLYLKVPAAPAGIFSYNVTMKRVTSEDPKVYPFVWRNDGPVELDKYFKY